MVFAVGISGCNDPVDTGIEVPVEFKQVYDRLDATLDTLHSTIDRQWDGLPYKDFIPMASVLPANSNTGEALLQKDYLDFVNLYVERLREMGCRGVQLDIQFPILDPAYFAFAKAAGLLAQDSPDDRDYLEFYKALAAAIKGAGLKLSIESQVVFTQETWSPLPVEQYYHSFDAEAAQGFEKYKQRKRAQLQRIAAELSPDYLTIGNEPETEMWLTGIKLLQTQDNYVQMTRESVDAVLMVAPAGMQVGSGFGIWSDSWNYWAEKLNELPVDFINIHIYAIDIFPADPEDNVFQRACAAADMAHGAGKHICLGETWLYKQSPGDADDPEVIYGRDYFDFWQPLDRKYLSLMLKIAHYKQFEFISPFWSTFFFSYLTYAEAKDLSTADRKTKNNRQAAANIYKNIYSETGTAYRDMIKNGPE
ncbi:MAG: hypothetical protein WCQ99_11080 [Pseudomonadota bacterium]